jgi:FkbM family methyltransferase
LLRYLTDFAARAAESHPYTWKLAWEAVHRAKFLLPHDKSYRALRHFIAARPEGLFLDVGANDGISALSFRRFSREYRILSLEPNGVLEPALRALKRKDLLFEYKMVGAGAAHSSIELFVPIYRGVVLHTFTAANRAQVMTALTQSFGRRVAASTRLQTITAEIIPVDALAVDPAIMKIDAEGFDYQVLLGADATIRRARPFVVVEIAWSDYADIARFFRERDYELLSYDVARDRFSAAERISAAAASGQRNFFAMPSEEKEALATLSAAARAMP